MVVWNSEDSLREANSQLSVKDVYREVKGDAEDPLMKAINSVLRKIRNRGDICDGTLDYFLVNNPKPGRFYLFPRIHKKLYNVPGRSVISDSECVLKNNNFELDKSVFKQLRGTAVGTRMVPPYAIIFMDSLEEDKLNNSLLKTLVWWRYIDDISMM